MKKTLIVGYGNRDREDDGAGWHMLQQLANALNLTAPTLPGDETITMDGQLKLIYLYQLLPEMAEDVSDYDRIFFLDAHNSNQLPELVVEPIFPKNSHSAFTHHLTPEDLLSITQTIGKSVPEAWLISVRGHSFRFAHELSLETAASVQSGTEQVMNMLNTTQHSQTLPGIDFEILHVDLAAGTTETVTKPVVREHACLLRVNGQDWITFICTPLQLEALAVGFLWNENVIHELSDVDIINVAEDLSSISVTLRYAVQKPTSFHRTSTGIDFKNSGLPYANQSEVTLSAAQIISLYREFGQMQSLHTAIGGFHSAALCDLEKPRIVVEDLGRHNCLDKLSGLYLLQGKSFTPFVITLSGRISSEMIAKIQALKVPFIVSRTSPTSLAVETGQICGITIVGYLKGRQFEVYTHPERVISHA